MSCLKYYTIWDQGLTLENLPYRTIKTESRLGVDTVRALYLPARSRFDEGRAEPFEFQALL
jgi:hypothetical protein